MVPALSGTGRPPGVLAGRGGRRRPRSPPAEHPGPARRRRLAGGRPLPRQPGLLLPRLPARRTRRPAARHRRAQRHLRRGRGRRRTPRLLPRRQQRPRPDRRLRLPAPRRRAAAPRRLPPLPRRPRHRARGPAHPRARPAARLAHPALQGQSADAAARHGRTRRTGRHPVRLRHHRQPPAPLSHFVSAERSAPCLPPSRPPISSTASTTGVPWPPPSACSG
ncbi:hypothetical protein SGPA1_11230 [Streptomyces misionensis JCM 4497]